MLQLVSVSTNATVATNLIHINHYNTNKQNLEKKIGDGDKKYLSLVFY